MVQGSWNAGLNSMGWWVWVLSGVAVAVSGPGAKEVRHWGNALNDLLTPGNLPHQ